MIPDVIAVHNKSVSLAGDGDLIVLLVGSNNSCICGGAGAAVHGSSSNRISGLGEGGKSHSGENELHLDRGIL